ncbi:receptor homology region, transmembrane domain- and RING domain-containing protein 2-like isoform X1 [Malus sylvestris]|uniref:receptor homology region, transmembrane domain- and RING domain-containing protein 2-like isoform X1 n=1 Tax=Malus sylvestris TaxID=3752 RepID=UPI0021AB9FA1|nr:receptor homology region, transmembrane domain- and RING domain-containing protein 2-like isoform X1 [Malus sylvestris]
MSTMNLAVVLVAVAVVLFGRFCITKANVVLMGNNVTLSFDDKEATFAPEVKGSGECGVLYLAEPPHACSTLTNQVEQGTNYSSPFVLIVRGGCSFEDKVRRAQKAGFKAAIIYDNEDSNILVSKTVIPFCVENTVAGSSAGIKIYAVFVSKTSGELLKKYIGLTNMELWLIASFENTAWSIMAISFISLLAMSAVLATCFFVRRHRIRRERPQASRVQEFHGMSKRLVKAMPSLKFTTVLEDNCTSSTCAICLEDYNFGEKLRILPCRHKFHAFCVDSWLTSWRTFCPVCKRDARANTGDLPASESTPLLSSGPSSVASSVLSSMRSSIASSSAIQIGPSLSRNPSLSHSHSYASTGHIQQSLRSSYRQSPSISASRSSMDLRNASSQRSHVSYFVSPHSMGYPTLLPPNSRYMSVGHIPSPSNASPSYMSSSNHRQHPLHCSESAATFSPFSSAQSLPEC